MMTILESIKNRRSIRKFTSTPVEESKIKKIIEAGQWAPSASNIQGWRFIVINDENLKKKIKEEGAAYFIKDAPVLIAVLYDNRTDNIEHKDYIQSASAAIQNMLLEIDELGLGACWVNNMPPKRVLRKILDIPKCFDPIAIVALGYYEKRPTPLKRKYKLEEIISYNKFDFPYEKDVKNLSLKRILRRAYFNMPKIIKAGLSKFIGKYEKRFDTPERYK